MSINLQIEDFRMTMKLNNLNNCFKNILIELLKITDFN